MTDYMPTTDDVRDAYQGRLVKTGPSSYELVDEKQADAEFDRWLDEVKAQAWEEGWMRCVSMSEDSELSANPYRQGEEP